MNKRTKKYCMLLAVILIMATVIVVWIGFLKHHKLKQPQGEFMELSQAAHLFNVLVQKADASMTIDFDKLLADSINEDAANADLVAYEQFQLCLTQLAEAELVSTEVKEKYCSFYDTKYKSDFYFLVNDFFDTYIELADLICDSDKLIEREIVLVLGADKVSALEDEQILSDNQMLDDKQQIFELVLSDEQDVKEIVSDGFVKLNCLADEDEIFYVFDKKAADVTLGSCFVAHNDSILEAFWGDYCVKLDNMTDYNRMEDIVDLVVEDGSLSDVVIYQNKVHGKLLSIGDDCVELSMENGDDKTYQFANKLQVYKLFGNTNVDSDTGSVRAQGYSLSDLKVGYDFTDFVLDESDRVVAALATREEAMDNIRVLIKNNNFESIYHDEVDFSCDTVFTVKSAGMEKTYEAGAKVAIGSDSELFQNDRILVMPASLTARISILTLNRNQGIPAYRGTLEFVRTEEGILCINELLLEEYLYSVVPSEMPSSYPLEAQKAQAVSARTYAYQHMVKSSLQKFGAHVDDSTSYQVYNNITETSATTEAVRETSGEIATIDGEVAGTYFYSTSCGFGTDISVWHNDSKENTKHLHAKAISQDAGYTPEQLMDEETFRAFITGKEASDYESEEGWYRWSYETKLDEERLLSNLQNRFEAYPNQILTMQADGSFASQKIEELGQLKDIQVNKRFLGGVIDELDLISTKSTIRVISERNIRYVLANQSDKVIRQTNDESSISTMLPSAFAVIDTYKDGDGYVEAYTVLGGGYGHGIGLSQNGAKNMAEAGMSCDEILQFFYEGIELGHY